MLIGGALAFLAVLINLVGSVLAVVLIGFLILPFALVPQILTQGYLVRVLDDTLDGGVDPPVWEEWTDVFVDGLKFVVVSIVYSLPVVVVSVVLVLLFAFGTSVGAGVGGDGGGAIAGLSVLLALVLGLVVLVLALAVFYVLPIGICGMAQDDAVGGAFDVDRIRTVATTREYAVAWGAGAVTLVVGGGVAQFLIFLLVGFPLLFAVQVLAFRFFARGYADALDLDVAPAGASPAAAGAGTTATSVPDPDPTKTDTLGATRPDEAAETTRTSDGTEPTPETETRDTGEPTADTETEFSADPVDEGNDTTGDEDAPSAAPAADDSVTEPAEDESADADDEPSERPDEDSATDADDDPSEDTAEDESADADDGSDNENPSSSRDRD
jgi:ABC-type glycerol-3-phosphate transport system permease component